MNVENIAREGLATGRTAQEEGQLAISSGVLCEVVINDQYVAARFHEMFRDAGRSIRSNVGETRWLVAFGHHDNGVIHRTLFPQYGHGFGNRGSALADGAIDTQDIQITLVEDGIDGNGGFASLAVSQNQLPLAAPDWNQRINDLEAGLEWHGHGRTVHDGRSRTLDGQALGRSQRPVAIMGPPQGVNNASKQFVAHGDVHESAHSFDFVACVQVPVFAQKYDTD